jgi:hypothetical protein
MQEAALLAIAALAKDNLSVAGLLGRSQSDKDGGLTHRLYINVSELRSKAPTV